MAESGVERETIYGRLCSSIVFRLIWILCSILVFVVGEENANRIGKNRKTISYKLDVTLCLVMIN